MNMKLDFDKLKALVHYVCDRATNPADLGSIKLNKVLWYADSINYLIDGTPITGETYVKRQHGPVPKHILGAIDALVTEGKIVRGRANHFGFIKNEYISLEEPDISSFKAEEISRVDIAFQHVCMNHTAKSISEETHDLIWSLAGMGEEIPYETVFASRTSEIDETDVTWIHNELGLAKAA